jgi:phage recombination protein Bet
MTSTAVATLPTGSDPTQWSHEEKALVEAAGLVAVDARTGEKTPAPRPVVAAFLQHCQRTGLDPFARQIYCLARKSKGEYKWTTQISIDGARLVAERTQKYEGQTTPEFTADGVTWTQVWLSGEAPRAARVGVYRAGFREPLYAVALWEAYAVYQDEWADGRRTGNQTLSAMWAKMGPLMLAKCAEMLALRKAFPQDLSGLYSSEEMQQAGGAAPAVPAAAPQQYAASTVVEYDQELGQAIREVPAQADLPEPAVSRDWAALAAALKDVDALTQLYKLAQQEGEVGLILPDGRTVDAALRARKVELEQVPLVEGKIADPPKRAWLREARLLTSREDVRALYMEAAAGGALPQVLEEIRSIERTLPDPDADAPSESAGWATPGDASSEWAASPADESSETVAGVLDDSIGGEER